MKQKLKAFCLPDLGEGLPDAEIVDWHVSAGDDVVADQPLVSMETAKAIVEVPSPRTGRIARLCGEPGDIVRTGEPLVEFEHVAQPREDTGTVVGEVKAGKAMMEELPGAVNKLPMGVKATPAVRAMAKRMEVELTLVKPSGPDGLITAADVQRAADTLRDMGRLEPLKGVRRAMARNMSLAGAEVVPVTISDDADVDAWSKNTDVTIRLIRAIVAGCRAQPSLNAWYDSHAVGRRVVQSIHLGIAVDSEDGLFVPVLRNVAHRDPRDLRLALDRIRADVEARSIPPAEMRGYTFTLSNFGTLTGRYASPVVLPPTVAILGAGRLREAVVAHKGRAAVRRILPLSLCVDHRAVTGGEAARFLAAAIEDLQLEQ